MNAAEIRADVEGSSVANDQPASAPALEGDWGWLKDEPCRFCRRPGKVFFLIDDGPEGKAGLQPMRCGHCNRTWTADSSAA